MVWRRRVILTRSSRAASSAGDGARTWTAAAGWLTGVGAEAARSIAASMSPLVTRPSLPEPGTVEASMPVSAESFRTDGASGASAGGAFAAGAGAGAAATAAGAAAAAGFAGAAAGFAAPAPSVIWPSSAPTATVAPSAATISLSVPAEGAGTSMVTLSVSSSTKGSSTATGSPAFLNQRPMVASVTDSPSVGTRISVMVFSLRDRRCGQKFGRHRPAKGKPSSKPDVRILHGRRGVLVPRSSARLRTRRGMTQFRKISSVLRPGTPSTAPDAWTSDQWRSRRKRRGRHNADAGSHRAPGSAPIPDRAR
ncbi:hypothetical protein ACVWZR_003490 [Bradyrhizobium sp. i1.3.1]